MSHMCVCVDDLLCFALPHLPLRLPFLPQLLMSKNISVYKKYIELKYNLTKTNEHNYFLLLIQKPYHETCNYEPIIRLCLFIFSCSFSYTLIKRSPGINRKSPGFLSSVSWPSMPKKHSNQLINQFINL